MDRILSRVIGAIACLVIVVIIPIFSYLWLQAQLEEQSKTLILPLWAALLLALITPFSIIAIRTQVRLSRVRMIDLFAELFKINVDDKTSGIVSFDFVRRKYFIDLPPKAGAYTDSDVPRFPMMLQADWMLLFCAIPYMVFSGFGIFLLLCPHEYLTETGLISSWLRPSLLAIGGSADELLSDSAQRTALHQNVLLIAALAFAGSYFFTLRLFLRAVVMFDLSPITFLRAFAHMVLAVILAIVLYRVTPSFSEIANGIGDLAAGVTGKKGHAFVTDPAAGVSLPWMLLAFGFGFIPETAILYAMRKTGLPFKDRETELENHAKVIPVTLLDGVDHYIAFRLEEANIYDVQNLATYNPIMLHVESPYGIYQCIDWVAQAQLCTVVGPERFMALKTLNIRTIFDLKRAVEGYADAKGPAAADAVLDAVADFLLQDDVRDRGLRQKLGLLYLPLLQRPTTTAEGTLSLEARRNALRQLLRVMLDDLHVFRLEQVWNHIYDRLRKSDA